MRLFCAKILFLLLALPLAPVCYGWGNTGHEAVAAAAWSHLDQPTKDRIIALLQQVPSLQNTAGTETVAGYSEWSAKLPEGLTEDQQHMWIFMRAATWPDSIKHHFFHDSDTPPADLTEAEANLGFTDRNSHGYWHFIDSPLGTAQGKGKPPTLPNSCLRNGAAPTPVASLPEAPVANAVAEISLLTTALGSDEDPALKAYDLLWLEHLVGDVHQPLHAANRYLGGVGDIGGNCVAVSLPASIRVKFVPAGSTARPPSELHAFWDDLPGVGTAMDTQIAADYAAALPEASATQAALTSPTLWAQESTAMAKQDAYSSPILAGFGAPKAFVITPAYYNRAYADAQQRIALAGARLANLLTAALADSSPTNTSR